MKANKKAMMTTRTLAYCALLAAISIALARLLAIDPIPTLRISFEKFPLFLAGFFFGPVAGGVVGFVADTAGILLFPKFPFNPLYCVPPILYGVFGGLFRQYILKKPNVPRLAVSYLPPVVLGSVLYLSVMFAITGGAFWANFTANLVSRSIQFAIVGPMEVLIMYLLFRSRVFHRIGIWPAEKKTNN